PSPYTRKMIALMRYRHIDYRIVWGDPAGILAEMGVAKPKVVLLPTYVLPDEAGEMQAVCDSTPIIRRLEAEHKGRSVIPTDPAMAFIDYLLEDFADEWCTKYMFHYRWHFEADADNAGTLLPLFQKVNLPADTFNHYKPYISERQVGRLHVVGSNDVTAPVIDASYRRLLIAMEAHLTEQPFLMGNRPGASDFAFYGQLTQLVGFDPTPRAIAHSLSPRTVAYTGLMEDQNGVDPQASDWSTVETAPDTLKAILNEVGHVYAPALLANAQAMQAGEKTWEAEIDGSRWTQQTFNYQSKCLQWINAEYWALGEADRTRVDGLLAGTGCEKILF
ncbi:MAG: glutathione S-transferase N-terminal domain-containing protein, partial [Porticoccaceae bacterium]|nr:glutathione S-transferase N-terminal domain-containing protein [Porticoccaceae bacterium]